MSRKPLQLAILTEYAYRVEAVEQLARGQGWRVYAHSGETDPLAALRQQPVDFVLVDLELPDAVALTGALVHSFPTTPVLALATPKHLVALQEARLAGAADFVAFPINHSHFYATVDRILHSRPQQTNGRQASRLIVVASLKGGVGRSTLAANLAVLLRQRESKDVILVEAHHSLGQLSLMLNIRARHSLANLNEQSNIDADLLQGMLEHHNSGVRLLAAPNELDQVVELSAETWQRTLSTLAEMAPYVVIDTAAVADAALSAALMQADEILVVTGPEIASLYSAQALIETLQGEQEVHGHLHIVINQADVNGGLSESTVAKHLGKKVATSIPSDLPLATYALNCGVPFVTSHPASLLSKRLNLLLNVLLTEGASPKTSVAHRRSLLSLLPRFR
jgi:pilus assembly protein CpaE